MGIGEGSGQQCSGRPTSPAWQSSPVHWYSKSYLQPDPWHGSATPQRTLPSAAHTFVASCHWDDDYEWDDGNEFAGTKYDDEPVAHIQSTAHPKEPKEPRTIGDPGAGGIFVIVLQSVVYLIGLVFCCGGLTYVVVQKNSGKSVWSAVPTLDPATLDPKSSVQMKKLAVTPDTTYSGSA